MQALPSSHTTGVQVQPLSGSHWSVVQASSSSQSKPLVFVP